MAKQRQSSMPFFIGDFFFYAALLLCFNKKSYSPKWAFSGSPTGQKGQKGGFGGFVQNKAAKQQSSIFRC
jgi:hypothetical protein